MTQKVYCKHMFSENLINKWRYTAFSNMASGEHKVPFRVFVRNLRFEIQKWAPCQNCAQFTCVLSARACCMCVGSLHDLTCICVLCMLVSMSSNQTGAGLLQQPARQHPADQVQLLIHEANPQVRQNEYCSAILFYNTETWLHPILYCPYKKEVKF